MVTQISYNRGAGGPGKGRVLKADTPLKTKKAMELWERNNDWEYWRDSNRKVIDVYAGITWKNWGVDDDFESQDSNNALNHFHSSRQLVSQESSKTKDEFFSNLMFRWVDCFFFYLLVGLSKSVVSFSAARKTRKRGGQPAWNAIGPSYQSRFSTNVICSICSTVIHSFFRVCILPNKDFFF